MKRDLKLLFQSFVWIVLKTDLCLTHPIVYLSIQWADKVNEGHFFSQVRLQSAALSSLKTQNRTESVVNWAGSLFSS